MPPVLVFLEKCEGWKNRVTHGEAVRVERSDTRFNILKLNIGPIDLGITIFDLIKCFLVKPFLSFSLNIFRLD